MLASTIITDVRRELLETSALYWSDAELLRHLNRAELDFVNKTRILDDTAQLDLVQGRLDYPVPSNFVSSKVVFHKQVFQDGTVQWHRLYPVTVEKMAQQKPNFLNVDAINQGKPTRYWIFEKTLFLDKAPDADNTTSIYMFYKAKPIPLTDTSQSINLDDTLSEAITAYILWKAWMKEQEFERADDQRTTYDRYIAEGRKSLKRQSGDMRNRIDIDSQQSLDGNFFPFGPLTD